MNEEVSSSNVMTRNRYIRNLIISTVATIFLTGIALLFQISSGRKFPQDGLLIWINSFTLGGGLMIMLYFLVVLTDFGAFDLLGYSMKLVWYNTFRRGYRKTHLAATFHEYRLERYNNKRENSITYLLYPGLLFLGIGLILLIPFYQNI